MSTMTSIANCLDSSSEQLAGCEAYGVFIFSILVELFCSNEFLKKQTTNRFAHLRAVIQLTKVKEIKKCQGISYFGLPVH